MASRELPGGNRLGLMLLAAGLLVQIWLWSRPVWLYRDQVELYTLGMEFARGGELRPFGKLMTGDYPVPGVLLQLLVGVPLRLWRDARSPTVLLILSQLAAALILWRVLAREIDRRVATLFLAVFWLSPWRLYHSGFLWEASFMFLPAAVHLWACGELRGRSGGGGGAWPSAVLTLTLALGLQVHVSTLILALATLWLVGRRQIDLHPLGAAVGGLVGGVTLWPTIAALLGGQRPPSGEALAGGILMHANSVEKAITYWFRLGSPDVGRRFRETYFCHPLDGGRNDLACLALRTTEVVALVGVVLSIVACWWFWRRRREVRSEPESWLRDYVLAVLVGVLAAALLSPILIQGWHLLVAAPAACLPVTLWIAAAWPVKGPPRFATWLRWAMLVTLFWRLPAAVLLGFGHPMYVTPEDPDLLRHVAPAELQELVTDRGAD